MERREEGKECKRRKSGGSNRINKKAAVRQNGRLRRIWFSSWWPVLLVIVLFLAAGTWFVYQVKEVMDQELLSAFADTYIETARQISEGYEREAQVDSEEAYEYAMAAMEWGVNQGNYSEEIGVSLCNAQGELLAERGEPTLYLEHTDNTETEDTLTRHYRCADPRMEQQVMEAYAGWLEQTEPKAPNPVVRIDEAWISGNVCYPVRVNIYSASREVEEYSTITFHLLETVIAEDDLVPEDALHLTNLDLNRDGSSMDEVRARVVDARETGTYYPTRICWWDDDFPKMSETIRKNVFPNMSNSEDSYAKALSRQSVVWDESGQSYAAVVIPIHLGREPYYFVLVRKEQRNTVLDSYVVLGWMTGILLSALIALVIARGFASAMRKEQELVSRQREYTNALAHDLKTPLMAISGYAENLQANGNPEKSEHYYEAIFSNIQYMQQLITDMLSLARLQQSGESLSRQEIDLRRLAETITADFDGELSEKNLHLTIEGNGQMEADPKLLERAVRNLVENAVKFSPAGEDLHIRLADRFIQITNTGVTLPKELWDTVFQPFVKGDDVRGRESGTGLGLAIVRDIAELHGFQCRLECGEQETTVILEG